MIYKFTYDDVSECYELDKSYTNAVDTPQFKAKQQLQKFRYKLRKVPYGVIEHVTVKIEKQKVVNGSVEWVPFNSEQVQLPQERCDKEQYKNALDQTVEGLPLSLQMLVSCYAYEHGHSSGYEECLNIANELAYELTKILPQLKKELTGS